MSRRFTAALLALTACASAPRATTTRAAFQAPVSPPDDGTPVIFAPGIVSTGDVFASAFTPDGRMVVFTKAAAGQPLTLMSSRYANGAWTAPVALPFSGGFRDMDPAFTPDGRRMYFTSRRPTGPSRGDTTSLDDTWVVDVHADGAWGAPTRVPGSVNSDTLDMYPSVTRNGTLYFDSMRSGRRMTYRARPTASGGFAEPELLARTINADSGSSNLFVDPNERFVVFAASRPGGQGGADLHVSVRASDGSWSPAVNLGSAINTAGTEFCPFVSPDARLLFFTRGVPRGAGQPLERNVYVARFDVALDKVGVRLPNVGP